MTGTQRGNAAEVDALLAAIDARYPGRFTDEDRARIREDIRKLMEAVAALHAVPLTNADEPDVVFHAPRREG